MDKMKRGRYFDSGESKPLEEEVRPKGRSRKQIEQENAERKKQEQLQRQKDRIKREIRREHLNGHEEVDYDIKEQWDHESKIAVFALFGLKILLISFVIFEIYHMIVFKKFFLF
ncbi:MAG: hypothetical protein OCC49_07720 [Fibrobacterales bacterium]